MKSKLESYKDNVIGKFIDEDGVYGAQCVDLVKNYTRTQLGITLGTFGGSAKTGWENKSNTFPASDWEKIPNNPSDKNQIPKAGDIIFFDGPSQYGHVGIVMQGYVGENRITVLNQNTGTGTGYSETDKTRVQDYTYSGVLGWYRQIKKGKDWDEINGTPIVWEKQPASYPNRIGMYHPYKKIIILYDKALTLSTSYFRKLLAHEYSHKVYWDEFTVQEVKTWESISRLDDKVVGEIKKKWTNIYWINKYISPGETNESEDFAETVEDIYKNPDITYGDYRDIKRLAVTKLMARHGYTISELV